MTSSDAVFRISGTKDVEMCTFLDVNYLEPALFAGMAIAKSWTPMPVELVRREFDGKPFDHSDAPWCGVSSVISFRLSVVEKIAGMLEQFGELLPLDCADAQLFAYNVTRVLHALDEQRSKIKRYADGYAVRIDDYVFSDLPTPVGIFKISTLRLSPIFVGPEFIELWRENGFVGLDFKQVWPKSEK